MDELGRGTATFDGTAIAYAVTDHLLSISTCCTLFATHYHSLIDDMEADPRVKLCHMDCIVQQRASEASEDDQDTTAVAAASSPPNGEIPEEVTFLFRLCDGSSPRSYGINVARLAGLPLDVIQSAITQSNLFEATMSHSTTETEVARTERARIETIVSYFDKLLSIVTSQSTVTEIAYYAAELWHRFKLSR